MKSLLDRLNDYSADPDFVYHFTTLELALRSIIPNSQLRFGRFQDMDDPYETEYLIEAIVVDGDNIKRHSNNQSLLNILRGNCRIKCFCEDTPYDPKAARDFTLNKGYAKTRMWSQYGDFHKGVCLVFSRKRLESALEADKMVSHHFPMQKVEYNDERFRNLKNVLGEKLIDAEEVKTYLLEHKDDLLFLKNEDYRDEDESRLCITDYDSESDCYINFGDALECCILGYKHDQLFDPVIEKLHKNTHVQFYNLNWWQGKPYLCWTDRIASESTI
ncbi:MAG TPA: DUF2971 domain-containing protein [bacterium]|nr:DUF2971 domain-containing protein [bacterium]